MHLTDILLQNLNNRTIFSFLYKSKAYSGAENPVKVVVLNRFSGHQNHENVIIGYGINEKYITFIGKWFDSLLLKCDSSVLFNKSLIPRESR